MLLLSLMICHRSLEHRQDNQRPHRALEQSRVQELRIRFTKGILYSVRSLLFIKMSSMVVLLLLNCKVLRGITACLDWCWGFLTYLLILLPSLISSTSSKQNRDFLPHPQIITKNKHKFQNPKTLLKLPLMNMTLNLSHQLSGIGGKIMHNWLL